MDKRATMIWFRNDLRLHDNEVFYQASEKSSFIIPVYCFDPRYFDRNQFGTLNTGVLRAAFVIEAVTALKEKLKSHGSDLLTYIGKPEDIIPRIAQKYQVNEVYHHREVALRETSISEKVESELWSSKINLRHFIGHTLYHKEDLPFPIKDIPNGFSIFKKKVERESLVRQPIPFPTNFLTPPHLEDTKIPSLKDLGYSEEEIKSVDDIYILGGEDTALSIMHAVLSTYPETDQDPLILGPFIASGALSPILLYNNIKKLGEGKKDKRFEKIIDILLWRDYFRFMLKKYPNIFFKPQGTKNSSHQDHPTLEGNEELFEKWKSGHTEHDFINSVMVQLQKTGYIPYQARLIAASYLVHEYQVNWLRGASWYEEHLLDYSPATVYGQWSHIAGVGTSEKDNKALDWQKLIKTHFPNGLPKLDEILVK